MDNNEPISHHDVEKLNEALARKDIAYLSLSLSLSCHGERASDKMSENTSQEPTYSHMNGEGRKSQGDRAVELPEQHGAMRRSELSDAGVHPETLARLVEDGILIRVARGLYQLTDADITAHHTLTEVAKLVPKGVVCLVSALRLLMAA